MKLVYKCRAGYENGRLRERPRAENGGWDWAFRAAPNGKNWGNKETSIFLNEGLLDLLRSEKLNKELYIFEKGGLLERPRTKK